MHIQPVSMPLYEQVIDFLAGGPSVQEIIKYQPPEESQRRVQELLDVSKQRDLTIQEDEELDHYIRIDQMMSLVKAKAYQRLDSGLV